MKRALVGLALAAALAFGLTSCSADEPDEQSATQPTDDSLSDLVMVTTTIREVGDITLSGAHLLRDAAEDADAVDAASPAPGGTSNADPELLANVHLRADGLGVASFGDDSDFAIAQITAALGTPLIDSGWLDTEIAYTNCPASRVRALEWSGFTLLFSDASDRYAATSGADTHFMSWEALIGEPFRLSTPEGINPGVTREVITEVYPLVSLTEASGDAPAQALITTSNGQMRAWLASNGVVTRMFAGTPCG